MSKSRMPRALRVTLIVFACALAVLLLAVAGYVAYVFLNYHRLEDNLWLDVENVQADSESAKTGEEYRIVTYNVGFGAYTPDYTFFMDGGESSWAVSEESVIDTIQGAAALVNTLEADIILLEEIDLDATRSYHVDESFLFASAFSDYCSALAIDYDSPFLFYPFTQPHGKSLSALGTYSTLTVTSSLRRSLPISEGFSKLLDLDRCYTVTRIPAENGKELVIYTVHLSAYGNSDEVREGQKKMLQEDMAQEVAAGNYVICGGDFNHDLLAAEDVTDVQSWAYPYPRSYLPEGMSFCLDLLSQEALDALAPTARNADIPYDPEESLLLTVDGFIISDNIEMVDYITVDTQFTYSDHNPVLLTFRLKD
ncbi:MAG: endonuclease/exonuclease/phosphatase family protein [Firmicutes bacterium]|nr:endonuclease/exonuclease/phosphatase family protein [Bacillota bacterium]